MKSLNRLAVASLAAVALAACSDGGPTEPRLDAAIGGEAQMIVATNVSAGDMTHTDLVATREKIPVGEVWVTHNGDGTVDVQYSMFSGFCLSETHVDAATEASTLTNRGGNPMIGRFAAGDDFLDCSTGETYAGIAIRDWTAPGDEYVVAAHAVVIGSSENPNVVFGTFDQDGDGVEEGDIYGINPTSGNLVLVADIPNDAGGDPFYPNGLAIDRSTEELFFVTGGQDLYKVPAENTDPNSVTPALVRAGISGGAIRSATIADGFYYFVPNGTDNLHRLPVDGSAAATVYCDLGAAAGLFFGDIAASLDDNTIYGSARVGGGGSAFDVTFFTADIDGDADCQSSGADFVPEAELNYGFQLQISFGADGTLYGQQAISEPDGDNPGQWYILDPATGNIDTVLSDTERSFTDIAGGIPFTPEEFDETAWALGPEFNGRSWAMFMGPFQIIE